MRRSAGGVVFDENGDVLLVEPTNHFGGYVWTFPKGGIDPGESVEAAALREVEEESGVRAEIVARIGDFAGSTSSTTYFLMRFISVDHEPDDETQTVAFVTAEEAARRIAKTHHAAGRARDLAVLKAACALLHRGQDSGPRVRANSAAEWVKAARALRDGVITRIHEGKYVEAAANRYLLFLLEYDYVKVAGGKWPRDQGEPPVFARPALSRAYQELSNASMTARTAWSTVEDIAERLCGAGKRVLFQRWKSSFEPLFYTQRDRNPTGTPFATRRKLQAELVRDVQATFAASPELTRLSERVREALAKNQKVEWREGYPPCERCGGIGWISSFKHVEGGICFDCGGLGLNDWSRQ